MYWPNDNKYVITLLLKCRRYDILMPRQRLGATPGHIITGQYQPAKLLAYQSKERASMISTLLFDYFMAPYRPSEK